MKRLLVALLAVLLLLSLCACTEDQGGGTTMAPTSTAPSSTEPTGSTVPTGDSTTSTTLQDVLDELDRNTTVTEHGNGVTTYTTEDTKPAIPTWESLKPSFDRPTGGKTTTASTASVTTTATKKTTTKKPTVITSKSTTTAKPAPPPTLPTTTTTTTKKVENTSKTTSTTKKTFSYKYTTGQKHTPIALEDRYYYSLMDAEWKGYYRQIDTAVRNMEEKVSFSVAMGEEKRYLIYQLYRADHPELIYLYKSVSVHVSGDGTSALGFCYFVSIKEGEMSGYGYGDLTEELKQKCLKKQADFDKAVDAIVSTIPASAPAVVKERMLYAKISLKAEYNMNPYGDGDYAQDNWLAYGVLVNGYGVCESFAKAFVTICTEVGIPATLITGDAGGGHMWSAVKLDGEWYQCDLTFDNPIGGDPNEAYFYYFNLTDAQMKERNHTWAAGEYSDEGVFSSLLYPKCTATKYSWENVVAQYGE